MRVKIECPINFLQIQDFNSIIDSLGYTLDSHDPECIIVNPGTDVFLDKNHFAKYPNLKVVGTPSTGVNHLDMHYLGLRNIPVKCLLDNRDILENIHHEVLQQMEPEQRSTMMTNLELLKASMESTKELMV